MRDWIAGRISIGSAIAEAIGLKHAVVAHDLKSPLSGISMSAQLAERLLARTDRDERARPRPTARYRVGNLDVADWGINPVVMATENGRVDDQGHQDLSTLAHGLPARLPKARQVLHLGCFERPTNSDGRATACTCAALIVTDQLASPEVTMACGHHQG